LAFPERIMRRRLHCGQCGLCGHDHNFDKTVRKRSESSNYKLDFSLR